MTSLNLKLAGIAVAATMLAAGSARAQFLDLSGMVSQNLAFDASMDQQARSFAQQWYLERQAWRAQTGYYGYLPGPFSTQDLLNANRETAAAYDSYNQAWHRNSNATSAAISNYTQQAISGYGNYTDGWTGTTYQLPNHCNQYFMSPQGTFYGSNTGTAPDPWTSYTELQSSWW